MQPGRMFPAQLQGATRAAVHGGGGWQCAQQAGVDVTGLYLVGLPAQLSAGLSWVTAEVSGGQATALSSRCFRTTHLCPLDGLSHAYHLRWAGGLTSLLFPS